MLVGERILSDIEKWWIFTIVKMSMFEVKYQPSVLWGPIPFQRTVILHNIILMLRGFTIGAFLKRNKDTKT